MNDEKIKVRITESGQTLDVVVLNKRAERIEVVLGEGTHSVRCVLTYHHSVAEERCGRSCTARSIGPEPGQSIAARCMQKGECRTA